MSGQALGAVVLGLGRSGTSAITGLFVEAGYHAGDDAELYPADEHNPTGYYEHLAIIEANDQVLAGLGATVFDPPTENAMLENRDRYEPILAAAFEWVAKTTRDRPLVIKDPRISAMLALWKPILDGCMQPVLATRHPVEIARSHARYGIPVTFALSYWELTMADLLRGLRGQTVTIAPYAEVTGSTDAIRSVIGDASSHLTAERRDKVAPTDGSGTIAPELRRHRARGAQDENDELTIHQLELWRWLEALPPGDVMLNPPEVALQVPESARRNVGEETRRQALATSEFQARSELHEARIELQQTRAQLDDANARLLAAQAARPRTPSRSWLDEARTRLGRALRRRSNSPSRNS